MQTIGKIFNELFLDLVFPRFCFGCNKEGNFLCGKCAENLETLNKNSKPLCPFNYSDALVREIIFAYKYDQLKSLDQTLADMIIQYFDKNKIAFDSAWTISFVPAHPKKQAIRGYNQSELLAKQLSKKLKLFFEPTLKKLRHTQPQMQLNRALRLNNLKGAFEAIKDLNGKKILLVDDVSTTGATLQECKKVLLGARARRVCCLAFAKEP